MFAGDVLVILRAILEHSKDNDIKFQTRKLIKKVSGKRYQKLSDTEQRNGFYSLIQEVRLGYVTLKEAKLKATDTIYSIIKRKTGIDQ